MSTVNPFSSFLVFAKSHIRKLNLFETGSDNETVVQNQRRSTRVFLLLLLTSMVALAFYYCITPVTRTITVSSPSFNTYTALASQPSLQCFCSVLAVKYDHFVQVEPHYHELCQSDLVSNKWISRLLGLYETRRSESILTDFYRIGVFQFRTLRSLCQLAEEAIDDDLRLFRQSEFIQTLLIPEELFHLQVNSTFEPFIDSIHTKFLRVLQFMQDIVAQSLLFTGAAVTSLQPKVSVVTNLNGVGIAHYGIQYTFADRSSCSCSSSTATSCLGPATINNTTIVGFQTGCYMFSALLKSTLAAFKNQSFIDMLTDSSETFRALNSSVSNETIEALLTLMLVTHWSKAAFFERYYNRCAPDLCQYTLRERHSFWDVVTLLIGLFGGLSAVLTAISPALTTTVWPMVYKVCRRRTHKPDTALNAMPPSLTIDTRVKQFCVLLKQKAAELNLFDQISPSHDEDHIREQRFTTRVYLTVFFLIVATLIVFTSTSGQRVTVTVRSPTMDTFMQLSDRYPQTLDCPCSQAAISYRRFLTYLQPEYHPVCLSDLISLQWINVQFLPVSPILTYDIRYQLPFHFQLLATLCRVARQTIDESLRSFYQTELVTTRALSREAFENQTDAIVQQFQRTVPESFQRSVDVIRSNLDINQFITSVNSEFRGFLRAGGINTVPLVYALLHSYINPECRKHESDLNPCTCFPLSYYTCYFPTIIQRNNAQTTIPGLYQTWFPLQALLESTLECFYNDTCLSQITDLINRTATPMNITTLQAPFAEKRFERVESLANRLFVESWNYNSSFSFYFEQCRPLTCEYSYITRLNLIVIVTSIVGLIGGVNITLRLLVPLLVIGSTRVRSWIRRRRSEPSPLHICNTLNTAFLSVTRAAIELNLFPPTPHSTNPAVTSRGRRTTRIYLLVLTAALFTVVFYASFRQETITETISAPPLATYHDLYKRYVSTLSCPCSRTTIQFSHLIVQLTPFYHELCSSVFISPAWIESLSYSAGVLISFPEADFRTTIRMQFQALAKLCAVSREIVNTSLITFLQTDLVTSSVLSSAEFHSQLSSTVEQFKRNMINQLLQTIKLMQVVNAGNQLAAMAKSNWEFLYKARVTEQEKTAERIVPVRTRAKLYGEENCSCAINNNCSQLTGFTMRTSKQSSDETLPGFRSGCLSLDALLPSTLACLYNRTCLGLMRAAIFYARPIPFQVLDEASSVWPPNTTVGALVNELFVSRWKEEISFDLYYDQCAPKFCHYSHLVQHNRAYIIAVLLALFGGLTKGLRLAMLVGASAVFSLLDRQKKKNTVSPVPSVPFTPLIEEATDRQIRRKGLLLLCCWIVFMAILTGTVCFIWLAGRAADSGLVPSPTSTVTMTLETSTRTTSTPREACSLMSESQARGIRTSSRSPTGLVTGDFNNDSFVDLVVTNPIDNTLSIFLGHRNGTFSSARVYLMPNGSRPWEIATADFNNDTILDLAVTLSGSQEIAVILGVTSHLLFNATPQIHSFYGKIGVPGAVHVADLDSDGDADLAVCFLVNQSSSGFSIYLNEGLNTGRFEEAILDFDFLVTDSISVAIGDFDGQGQHDDLVGINDEGEVTIIRAINYTTIDEYREITTDMYAYPSLLIRGKFNWDDWDDVAMISPQSDTLQILMAYDDQMFTHHIYLTDAHPTSLARIDFNHDSIDDIAVLSCNRTLNVFVGSDIGLFERVDLPLLMERDGEEGECARALTVDDFNGDGNEDVAFIDAHTEAVRVLTHMFCHGF